MDKCNICPRKCGINRKTSVGFCGEKALRISHIMLHHWEEPAISGAQNSVGSGAIFFTGCNLKCVYCQNWEISNNGTGKIVTPSELVEIFKKLEVAGASNINLVTPTHFADEIIEALKIYKPHIPVIWNTSGYERVETIEKLKGLVDVFLTDIRYFSPEASKKYSLAEDYFACASVAIKKMREVVGADEFKDGFMQKGMIVRLLVLPNMSKEAINILDWIKDNLDNNTIVSIMNQYLPCYKAKDYPEINRKVKKIEYDRVVSYAKKLGFLNAYIQENSSSSQEFIPNFKGENLFKF